MKAKFEHLMWSVRNTRTDLVVLVIGPCSLNAARETMNVFCVGCYLTYR